MKRVLIVGDFLNGSGLTKFIMNIYPKINPEKVHIDVINIGGKEDYLHRVKKFGWKMYNITPANKDLVIHIKQWKKLLSRIGNHYDVIHFHYSALWNFLPILYAKKYGIKNIILHSHNTYFSSESSHKIVTIALLLLHNIGKKIIQKTGTGFFACSVEAAKWFYNPGLFKKNKVTIIKNGIDLEQFEFNPRIREQMRKKLNLTDKFVIGHIGVFEERKNHRQLLDIFEKVHRKRENSVLLLVGQGSLIDEMKQVVEAKNLTGSVHFLGIRSDIPDLMQAFDAFVFPSLFEGLGIVLVEAQASGLPCFVSERIPHEAYVTDQVHQMNLSETPEYWAKEIMRITDKYNRTSHIDEIASHGYSARETAEFLEKYYCSLK
ncbi:glycosyltransferase family 1 protein [Sporolactobacillus sp. THM19-2]|uniref:glycosyltransferase family 1 protein n=1 Tax=Sporolactobacillus sp. THM19-2 TaxID=2511171 RepID=UPI0013EB905D|nr:glycosyltransferase family 1 protein [Sporolactobacillus sp. THM19-2]